MSILLYFYYVLLNMNFMQKLLLCLKTNSRDEFLRHLWQYLSVLPTSLVNDISCDNSLKENGENNTS